MRFAIVAVIGLAIFITSVHGAKKEKVSRRAEEKTPDRREKQKSFVIKQTLNQILSLDGRNRFQPVRSLKTIQGSKKVRAKQIYSGLEVFGANAVYSVDDNHHLTGSLSGSIVMEIDDDIDDIKACMRSEDELFNIGKKKAGLPVDCAYCSMTNFTRKIYVDDKDKAHLAYEIQLYDKTPKNPSRPFFIIDACDLTTYVQTDRISKKPLARFAAGKTPGCSSPLLNNQTVINRRQACSVNSGGTGGNPKTGDLVYGTDPKCLNVHRTGSTCTLESSIVRVVDLRQTTDKPGTTYSYDCNTPDDEINGAKSANLDAFFYGTVINDVYQTNYGMSPLTSQLLLYVHFDDEYENAFWDGSSMTFGDGFNYFYPLVGLDITAHEIAHGITEQNSDLIYSRQSGAISEAFSDISGEAVEKLAPHRGNNDWKAGFEITKHPTEPLRYFEDPTLDGNSIDHIDDYSDSLSIHSTSGIYNKAFYELVVTQGVPMKDAYGCFLDANMIYWVPDTDFVDGACGVKSAAVDRGVDVAKINAAFSVVGIDTSCCEITADTLYGGTITDMTVSDTMMTCYTLLQRTRYRRFVRIKAVSDSGETINIKISSGLCETIVANRNTALRHRLPRRRAGERVVCFSAGSEVDDVTVTTKYCRRRNRCRV